MAESKTADPRGGFRKRWSKMADFKRVDPSRRISEQLNQDGGFQNSWYKRRISKQLIQDGGFQNNLSKKTDFRTADTRWRNPKQLIQDGRTADPGQLIQIGGFQNSWFAWAEVWRTSWALAASQWGILCIFVLVSYNKLTRKLLLTNFVSYFSLWKDTHKCCKACAVGSHARVLQKNIVRKLFHYKLLFQIYRILFNVLLSLLRYYFSLLEPGH